jgi:hypothetical protein
MGGEKYGTRLMLKLFQIIVLRIPKNISEQAKPQLASAV